MTDTISTHDLAQQLEVAERLIENLQQALQNARLIGAAIGIIMALEKVTYDAGFDILSRASQAANTKLCDVAEQVLLTGDVH